MGKNWAIAIGINQYYFLHRLQYAEGDALAFGAFCQQQLNCEMLYCFSDSSPPIKQDFGPDLPSQPTSGILQRFFDSRFQQSFLGAEDNLWFFFAGHGIRANGQDYLMPSDASVNLVTKMGLSITDITHRLRCSGAGNVVLLLDACRSEEQAGRRGSQGAIQGQQPGVVMFFSCSAEESSYEIEELKQGAFTHTLLRGLEIQGEGNCATVELVSIPALCSA